MLGFEVTTLHYPSSPAVVLADLGQFTDGEVAIPLNDGRTGKVTISVYDDALRKIHEGLDALDSAPPGRSAQRIAYATALRATYNGQPVLNAPITLPQMNGKDGTMTFNAVDNIRLVDHYLRIGDVAIDRTNAYVTADGWLPIDHRGLRLLRDAALNTTGQTTRGVPNLGIIDGTNTAAVSTSRMQPDKDQQVWDVWTQLIGHELAPDFEFEPIFATSGAYARLNTYDVQGSDKSALIVMHFGFGRRNLDDFQASPGGKIITHQRAVSTGTTNTRVRVTRAHVDSSAYRGVYAACDASKYTASLDALSLWALEQVMAYGVPPNYVTIALAPEPAGVDPIAENGWYRYLRDFTVGDVIHAESKRGYSHEIVDGRIMKVTLSQENGRKAAVPKLEIAPNVATGTSIDTGEDA